MCLAFGFLLDDLSQFFAASYARIGEKRRIHGQLDRSSTATIACGGLTLRGIKQVATIAFRARSFSTCLIGILCTGQSFRVPHSIPTLALRDAAD
jgi:hypothetical protein